MLGLVTANVAEALDPDLEPLRAALAERLGGDRVETVAWDDASVDWEGFDAVVIRSTWDYTDRLEEFLAWVDVVAEATRVFNPPDVIRWNTDKRYLSELSAAGIPIVPTTFVAPDEPVPHGSRFDSVHVVKPTVGAGSSGARRCDANEIADHVRRLHGSDRTAMIQPYLGLLDDDGETALCFVAVEGELRFSHAFGKAAILTGVDVEQEGDLFAKEHISPRIPCGGELDLARAVLTSHPVAGFDDVLYARVDVAPIGHGEGTRSFVVLELELIEPSFYFGVDDSAVGGFADAVVGRTATIRRERS